MDENEKVLSKSGYQAHMRGQAPRVRTDILYKTIFRDMKKYYKRLFNIETGFIYQEKTKSISLYKEALGAFVKTIFRPASAQ